MTLNFQDLILNLSRFWSDYGCIIQQPYDIEKGASTMNPATFLRALGPEPYSTAMVEPCRRPTDARYGENPNRLGHYFQYQVILKPSPDNAQELYLKSLEAMGIDLTVFKVSGPEDLELGEVVRITSGPFVGQTGTVKHIDTNNDTARVCIDAFGGKETPLEVSLKSIERI